MEYTLEKLEVYLLAESFFLMRFGFLLKNGIIL